MVSPYNLIMVMVSKAHAYIKPHQSHAASMHSLGVLLTNEAVKSTYSPAIASTCIVDIRLSFSASTLHELLAIRPPLGDPTKHVNNIPMKAHCQGHSGVCTNDHESQWCKQPLFEV